MAKKTSKAEKLIVIRPTVPCGDTSRDFIGMVSYNARGYTSAGALGQLRGRMINQATDQANAEAEAGVRSMVCPFRCLIKDHSCETKSVVADAISDQRGGNDPVGKGRVYWTSACATVTVTATVHCKEWRNLSD